jgi:hypothetical protein
MGYIFKYSCAITIKQSVFPSADIKMLSFFFFGLQIEKKNYLVIYRLLWPNSRPR